MSVADEEVRRLQRRYLWTVAACLLPQLLWIGFLVWFIVSQS
jgi:hypothetical protein